MARAKDGRADGGGLIDAVAEEAGRHAWHSAGLLLFTGLVGAGSFGIPIALERAIEGATDAGMPEGATVGLTGALLALAGLGLLRGAASWGRDSLLRRLRARRVAEIDREVAERAMALDGQTLARLGPGPGGAADAVAAGERIAGFLFGDLPATLAEAATALALLALLFGYDWRMGCLGLALALWNTVVVWRLARGQAAVDDARARSEAALADGVEVGLSAIESVKLGRLEGAALAAWLDLLEPRRAALAEGLQRGEAIGARQAAVAAATQAAAIGAGGLLIALEPGFGVGDLFACLTLIFGVNDPARRLLDAHADASRASVELLRRWRLLTAAAASSPEPAPPAGFRRRIVDAQPEDWAWLARDLPGAALVTGPADILPGTLQENVTLFRPADPERIAQALAAACLEDVAEARGDSRLNPGAASLSTGQRVRLAVARAVYAEAPAILLAGGLERLDRATALEMLRRLDRLPAGLAAPESEVVRAALPNALEETA